MLSPEEIAAAAAELRRLSAIRNARCGGCGVARFACYCHINPRLPLSAQKGDDN